MKLDTKTRKKFRVTNKLKKSAKLERYRLSIFRSSKNISAQIIDDNKNKTKEPQGLEAYDEGELRGGSEHGEMKTITGSPFNYDWGIKLPTQVIYFDEMRVGSTKEEVDVSLNDEPVD